MGKFSNPTAAGQRMEGFRIRAQWSAPLRKKTRVESGCLSLSVCSHLPGGEMSHGIMEDEKLLTRTDSPPLAGDRGFHRRKVRPPPDLRPRRRRT